MENQIIANKYRKLAQERLKMNLDGLNIVKIFRLYEEKSDRLYAAKLLIKCFNQYSGFDYEKSLDAILDHRYNIFIRIDNHIDYKSVFNNSVPDGYEIVWKTYLSSYEENSSEEEESNDDEY